MVLTEVPFWVAHTNPNQTTKSREQESLDRLQRKCAIYSVDCHGNHFATGGGDGMIRIWNVGALFRSKPMREQPDGTYVSSSSSSSEDNTDNNDTNQPKNQANVHDLNSNVRRKPSASSNPASPSRPAPLTTKTTGTNTTTTTTPTSSTTASSRHTKLVTTLSPHTGSSVLAVRFSNRGEYLASAGDDAVVCISETHHWTRLHVCRGHNLDVVDLTWAPDDSHFVSCSLDRDTPMIVWKMMDHHATTTTTTIMTPYKILGHNVHTSTVKGVTFDPAGSYFASSGDDPAVCIWRAHDDWGLEQRISDGIFRKWDETTSISMFRRISWSTDGAFVCSTNSIVKNKHVASTISRDGWSVSSGANLVGHKQPVVCSRHCAQLLDARKQPKPPQDRDSDDDNSNNDRHEEEEHSPDDEEPKYATLLALGDKRGFITVWSTKKSRPLFKLQCSESRCTVTDLAWGQVDNGLLLLVSLLDGQLVALRFTVPDEIGPILSKRDHHRVFSMRYGIDFDDTRQGGMFVGASSKPKFIENAVQMSLEESMDVDDDVDDAAPPAAADGDEDEPVHNLVPRSIKDQQKETSSRGKKRVQPVLVAVGGGSKKAKATDGKKSEEQPPQRGKSLDPVQDALDASQKASSLAQMAAAQNEAAASKATGASTSRSNEGPSQIDKAGPPAPVPTVTTLQMVSTSAVIPHSSDRVHSVELLVTESGDKWTTTTATCTNSVKAAGDGASSSSVEIAVSEDGRVTWRDRIPGTACCAIAACATFLAVGTNDGVIQIFGTSPMLGWKSGQAFRSHPPLVIGHAIVSLRMTETMEEGKRSVSMVVVAADGFFGVYSLLPQLCVNYKGSIMPAMHHMALSTGHARPQLSRIQMTDRGHLLLLLARTNAPSERHTSIHARLQSSGAGGSLQAFVYDRSLALWWRVSDSRFVGSEYFRILPSKANGPLERIDHAVRSGSLETGGHVAYGAVTTNDEDRISLISRAHCEDRMACAVALGSSPEFQQWLGMYVRTLTAVGHGTSIRNLVDMLLLNGDGTDVSSCWWLSAAPTILGLDRKTLVKTVVIPGMSKNRALQRLTNEISLELSHP